ncbi:hypothetical protein MCCG_0067 [Mycoplasma capricolum subsp. capripneumoniae 87001]|uniref:Uncharacterized protein n=1 Tax=Mycoplasma capricolum subsp. capripneumoniae 87001 TaxID=1124992 RepID=A0A9N7B9G9_MYCCC|nr:hypothetical protein [Mycoplasma capricolum]AJK51069.1 hypothetical protein MCCG_0067 [Mycoplasma capricolum subsp. capripneumoniae 87001]
MFKNHLLDNGIGWNEIIKVNLDNPLNGKYNNLLELYNYLLNKTTNKDIKIMYL